MGKDQGSYSLLSLGSRGHHHSITILEGQLQREWKLSLHREQHGEDKGKWALFLGEVSSCHKKNFFYHVNNHQNNTPRDVVEFSSLEVFRIQLDRVLNNFI